MRRPGWIGSVWPSKPEGQAARGSLRDRLAVLLALVTIVCLAAAFLLSKGTQFLMPGPLASAHGGIEKCSACHTKSGDGKVSWVHGLVAGDPVADSKACLTCHKMPETAFNAHGASNAVLDESTKRLAKIASETPQPQSARAQKIAFPTHDMATGGLTCATCHQEHQGVNFNLNKISNEQCRSCHVVKFDSFDGNHPKFDNYPFKRRTPIIYDHAGHFGKHFPEVAKKDPARRIPDTCSACHDSRADKRIMAVAPFDKTCTSCHLNQITGKERVSGPKGVAFLSLPGLDIETLKKKNALIGEWPGDSEAVLTPFMKVMISRNERGRALIKTVDSLNLQDLAAANGEQIKAVTSLVWEIKGLFYALIKGKASDVLGDFGIGGGAKLSADLVADLTASIPRDVVASAQQQWLPNLATEMANRPAAKDQEQGTWKTESRETKLAGSASPEELPRSDLRQSPGKEILIAEESSGTTGERLPLPSGTPRSIKANQDAEDAGESEGSTGNTLDSGRETLDQKPVSKDADKDQPEGAAGGADTAKAKPDGGKVQQPPSTAAKQTDDLLFPTEEELRGIKSGNKDAGKQPQPDGAAAKTDAANAKPDGASKADANATADAPAGSDTAVTKPQTSAAPVIGIESDVDPESWADYGGWYRQDYAIFYRPTGHKDKFIYSWLFLTGPQAPKGDTSPAAAVFEALTNKDAQGSCTKCHSVDDIQGKGRVVNFSPPKIDSKQGRFTSFIHEPHFGLMDNRAGSAENRGCLTCHGLEKGRPYLKSYEQGDPKIFESSFGAVKKDLCQTCHTSNMARQDCLLCHQYHVNGVVTPIMSTKLPAQ